MAAVLNRPGPAGDEAPPTGPISWWRRPAWNRFTPLQLLVLSLATIAPLVVGAAIVAGLAGIIATDTMIDVALEAGEDPGMITFGAMFLASPVQWLTGRSQVRVRKYLGIVFFLLATSNGAMFVAERDLATAAAETMSSPFLVAGGIALLLSLPLFLTSSRWSQRTMGMKRWRLLHKATYLVAVALLAHLLLIPDIGPGSVMIAGGFVLRIPAVRRRLTDRQRPPKNLQ